MVVKSQCTGCITSYTPIINGYVQLYTRRQWLQDATYKYTEFQLENSNNIISGILYDQFLTDRESYGDIVGYFYDVAPGQII